MSFLINGKVENRSLLQYCPHGIDSSTFFPYDRSDRKLIDFRNKVFSGKDFNFVVLYNSRNVNRKRTSNIILGFRMFCDNLPKEQANKCVLILHTEIMQDQGTNLLAVKEALCPDYNILFSPGKFTPQDMCLLYNVADVTVNVSSNEGFGLSSAESIMCGTPTIVTVTGGLQDQIGQVDDNGNPVEFSADFGSNHVGKYKKHGVWTYPIWPTARVIQGSIPTPYIFDDLTKWEDVGNGIMYWYMMGDAKRTACGMEGRKWAMNEGGINSKNMAKTFIDGMEFVFNNWVKPKQFALYSDANYIGNQMTRGHMGFEIPTINKSELQEKINTLPV